MPCGAGCSSTSCPRPADGGVLPAGLCATRAVAVVAFNDDGLILEANTAMAQLVGQSAAALLGQRLSRFLTPAGRVVHDNHLLPVLKLSGRIQELALQLRPAQGPDVFVMCSAVRLAAAGVARNECALMPMNERKRAEAELLRIKQSVEHMPGALLQLVQGSDGLVCVAAPSVAVCALLGLPGPGADARAPLLDALVSEDAPRVDAGLQASARDMTPWRGEFRVQPGDAQSWRAIEVRPQRLPDGSVLWHGLASDISSRKAVETAQMERDAAQRASRLKDAFLANMSHEMRTPLNAVIGLSQLMQAMPAPDKVRQYAGYILQAGEHLLGLVNDVLDLSRIEAGEVVLNVERFDLHELLQSLQRQTQDLVAAKALRLGFEMAPGVPRWVEGDAARIRQLLMNLLDNAVKFTAVGSVTLRVGLLADQAGLRFDVVDTGIGIAPHDQPRIFDLFTQADSSSTRRFGGTGLGLALVRRLVGMMDGRLTVQSVPGQGSTFTVELPLRTA